MKVLIIGGTGFIGTFVSKQLLVRGNDVTIVHRGQTTSEVSSTQMKEIAAEHNNLDRCIEEFKHVGPEVVIDMIPMCEDDARDLINAFRGIAKRLVVISSADVYRNYELLRGITEAFSDPRLITESSPLRENLFPYRNQAKDQNDQLYNYDKILVERVVMNQDEFPVTILRLPAVYGPGDKKHRLFPYLKRMDDGRPAILVEQGLMDWRWTRGYVENVAAAISWAAGDQRPISRIYNVGESKGIAEKDWIQSIAEVVGWKGKIVAVAPSLFPEQMRSGLAWQHQLETDTSLIRSQPDFSEPFSFREGISRTIAWERENPSSIRNPGDFNYEAEDRVLATVTD